MDGAATRERIAAVRAEHRALDEAITASGASPIPDQLEIARLKKRKLRLRDELSMLEDRLVPDIIA